MKKAPIGAFLVFYFFFSCHFCPNCLLADLSSFFNEKSFGRLTKKVTKEPNKTQIKIKMINGSLKWTSRKLTVTVCILASEMIAINKMDIKSATY